MGLCQASHGHPQPSFGMAVLALSVAWPCTGPCAVFNCMKLSHPKNRLMLIGLQPYELLPHPPANPALVAVPSFKSTSGKRQMLTPSSSLNSTFKPFQTWLVGCSPAGISRNAQNASSVP